MIKNDEAKSSLIEIPTMQATRGAYQNSDSHADINWSKNHEETGDHLAVDNGNCGGNY